MSENENGVYNEAGSDSFGKVLNETGASDAVENITASSGGNDAPAAASVPDSSEVPEAAGDESGIMTGSGADNTEADSPGVWQKFFASLSEEGSDNSRNTPDGAASDDGTGYDGTWTEDDIAGYRESIKRLKSEYKAKKKAARAERARERNSAEGKRSAFGVAVLSSVVTTLVICLIAGFFIFFFPTKNSSWFSWMVKKYSSPSVRSYEEKPVEIGGETVSPGSNVTINVDGELNVAAVFAKVSPSVVAIITCQTTESDGKIISEQGVTMGSGVVVSSDGEILTNHHVISNIIDPATGNIADGYRIYAYFDNPYDEPFAAVSIMGYDEDSDLALVKFNAEGLTPIEFFDSDNLSVGEPVVAIGSPRSLDYMNSVCDGIISGVHRSIVSSSSGKTLYDMVQMTAPINPGNSGGAVVNAKGQLVGISVIKIVAENFENMSFAISSNTALRIIESIRTSGRYVQPVLGVVVNTNYNWRSAKENDYPLGAYVVEVSAGGAAEEAGVLAGDIICGIGGVRTPDYTTLRTELLKYSPDDEVVLNIFRTSEGKNIEIRVKVHAS